VRTQVDIFTATLGGKVPVPSLNGRFQVVIPPGTKSSRRLRLTGKGIRKPDGAYGDLYILIEIVPPKKLTLEQRVLLRKLRSSLKYPASG
jgi:curved DNA-binding protein